MPAFNEFMQLKNKDAVIQALTDLEGDIQEQVVAAMKEGGKEIKKHLKAKIGKSSKKEPSIPGSAPGRLTGELRNSVYAKVEPLMLGEPVTLKISMRAFFARMLEFGTSKMAARPFFFSGVVEKAPALFGQVRGALAEYIGRRRYVLHPRNARRRNWTTGQILDAMARDEEKLESFDTTFGGGE